MSSDLSQVLLADRPERETGLNPGTSREGHAITSSGEFVDIHVADQQQLQEAGVQTEGLSDDAIGQLRLRIRELEEQILSRNLELQDKDCLKRNNDAVLEKLVKVQAEKQVVEEDREKYCEEIKLYRQQAEEKTKENDEYRERLQEMYRQQSDSDKKIKQLEKEVLFWKGKYENHEVNGKENRTRHSRPVKNNADILLPQIQNMGDYGASFQKNNIDFTSFPLQENGSLRIKHETNLNCQPKRRRHTFHQSPTVLPRCKNCLTVFDRMQPHEIQCSFHRSGPQPLKAWKKQIDEDSQQFDHPYQQAYMYWPCCGRTGLKEPPGCLKLRTHDLIIPEED